MTDIITIDGSMGEGGGQVLRSSLTLSLATGKPFRIANIRASRKKGGLLRQHLTAVRAAIDVGRARCEGAEIGGTELSFVPGKVTPGTYHFSVGTAGSTTLVLQTILPALAIASGPSTLTLEGGTHNAFAPSFDFFQEVFLPCLCRMGPKVQCRLERPGFYPAGGGRFTVSIEPARELSPIELPERGEVRARKACALVSKIPDHVGHREIKVVRDKMGWDQENLEVIVVKDSYGPGNVLWLELECSHVTEMVTAFGEPGVSAERVAERAVKEMRRYMAANVPVGKYLADQLLVPLALAGGGRFRTMAPSQHTLTNIEVIKEFLNVDIGCESIDRDLWEIRVSTPGEEQGNNDHPRRV